MSMQNNNDNGKALLAFLAGAAAAAAVGGYYLYGPNGRRHRQDTEDFIESTKERIIERLDEAGDWSREAYERAVDEVTHDARLVRRVGSAKARALGKRFKSKWQELKAEAESAAADAELELVEEDDQL